MAIEYFSSMLDAYYTSTDLNARTVLEAKSNLRSILGSGPLAFTLSSERALLRQALENAEAVSAKESESITSYYNTNVGAVSAAKATYEADPTNTVKIEAYKSSIEDFFEGFNSQVRTVGSSLGAQVLSIRENAGILPSEWASRVTEDIVVLTDLTLGILGSGAVSVVSGVGSALLDLDNYVNLGIYIVNPISGLLADTLSLVFKFFTNPIKLISNGAEAAYRAIAPTAQSIADQFVGTFQSQVNPETYISSTLLRDLAVGARESIIENGLIGTAAQTAFGVVGTLLDGAGNLFSNVLKEVRGWDWVESIEQAVSPVTDFIGGAVSGAINLVTSIISSNEFKITLQAVGDLISSVFPNYVDGVSESRYGQKMERSWIGSQNSFLNNLQAINVNLLSTTPLDPSEGQNASLYGNMMLGAPLTYTRVTDPNNRAMINTFVKDSTFLSLTPGLPKYNGGAFQQEITQQVSSLFRGEGLQASTYLNQTDTPEEMVAYLLKNGLDSSFAEKDKRYYTFRADYEQYFSYLETMLNTLWVKMGLGTAEDGSLNIFSFFNPQSDAADYDSSLRDKYRSSIGFFVNPEGAVSEGVNNSTVSSDLGNAANSRADDFQRINYITGMGTGGTARNVMRQIGLFGAQRDTLRGLVNEAGADIGTRGLIGSVINFANNQDISSILQQFQVTNGMKVMYPELWTSSSYAKNMTFSFNFVSPYGDPLSIFQYVYVPFFSLLAFAMPRQAAENGLVSPFLVRADMPGIITSDLAMITSVDWVKGGQQGLFTKDKLPRAISGTFTVQDLYPYLSAVKRLSFLSANPSFTVFLDNMAGLRALYNEANDDPYADYWRKLVNRVSGRENDTGLWNAFGPDRQQQNSRYATTYQRPSLTRTISKKAAPWLSKI